MIVRAEVYKKKKKHTNILYLMMNNYSLTKVDTFYLVVPC